MPIFMVGTQRSGSNFLRLILNQSDELVAPHPPHIIDRMVPLLPLYEGMDGASMTEAMMDDVCDLVDANPVPWYDHAINRKEAWGYIEEEGFIAVFDALYKQYAARNEAKNWVCKSLANVNHMPLIHEYYRGREKYIYLYRDGRDVALSFKKAVVGEKHTYMIADQWRQDQERAIAFWRKHETRVFPVAYERLVKDMDDVLEPLCEFVGISYSAKMHSYYRSKEAERTAASGALWANVVKPAMKDNFNKFMREMSQEEVRMFESVAGETLIALGYARFVEGKPAVYGEKQVAFFREENERLKKEIKLKLPPEDLEKRAVQSKVMEEIRDRRRSPGKQQS